MAVVRIETGIAVSEIAVVRQLRRNANRTPRPPRAASSSTRCDVADRGSMKLACRNRIWSALMPCGKLGQICERLLDLLGETHRVDAGLLFDRDDHGGLAHEAGVAALDLGCERDGRHLPQQDRAALDGRDHDAAQIVQAGRAADIADEIFAGVLVGEAAAGVDAELRERLFELLIA